jgi:hypothetical protein
MRQQFVNDDDTAVVMTWLQVLDQNFFVKCFIAFVSCWDRYLSRDGNM